MKSTKYIIKSTLTLSAVFFLLAGCSKKSNVASESKDYSPSDIEALIGGDEISFSKDDELQRAFALADLAPETDFNFELTDDYEGVAIKKYKGSANQIIIPSEIQGIPVVELEEYAFSHTKVVTVVIPDTVQKLGRMVFSYCGLLENIKLPKGLTVIPDGCFEGCQSFSYFKIPETITNIESSAFCGTAIESIYIPDTVVEIVSSFVFAGCKQLKDIRLPENMKVIPMGMFSRCENLESITLPPNITEIKDLAFEQCKALTSVIIPSSVTTIGKKVFDESGITKLDIPNSVTSFGSNFNTCTELTELHLPDSITEIKNDFFHKVDSYYKEPVCKIRRLNIPASIKEIDDVAFRLMKDLTELEIPDSITEIKFKYPDDNEAFFGCSSLSLVTQKKLKQLGYPGNFN